MAMDCRRDGPQSGAFLNGRVEEKDGRVGRDARTDLGVFGDLDRYTAQFTYRFYAHYGSLRLSHQKIGHIWSHHDNFELIYKMDMMDESNMF